MHEYYHRVEKLEKQPSGMNRNEILELIKPKDEINN